MPAAGEKVGAFDLWHAFTPTQRRNIAIYAAGIACYKFGLEWFNGAFISLANERFKGREAYSIALLTGLNYAAQSIGSILVAPLIKRYPTRSVLATAVLIFGLISTIPMIADAATGGQMRFKTANNKDQYGRWDPNGLFPIYVVSGVSYGVVELIRRVIPRDIVGGDVTRLRRMDALVHVLYEIAGTTGAFTSTALIQKFGFNYSCFLSPICFCLAAVAWTFISSLGESRAAEREAHAKAGKLEQFEASLRRPLIYQVGSAFASFGYAFVYGGYLLCTDRKFIWLIPGYTLALYGHRYLENGLAPIIAKQLLGNSSYSQIMVGGSNFGELLGALSVMLCTNAVPTPIPWLRLDALMLNLVWVLPFFPYAGWTSAWAIAGIFVPVSFGWAAGDVSLAAYIQSMLSRLQLSGGPAEKVSPLGAVMAFLYVTYIILYAVIGTSLGRWVDSQLSGTTGATTAQAARNALKYVGGTHFTVLSVIVIAATFIPRGSFALNPRMLDGVDLENENDEHDHERQLAEASAANEKASIDDEGSVDKSNADDAIAGPEVLAKFDQKANAVAATTH